MNRTEQLQEFTAAGQALMALAKNRANGRRNPPGVEKAARARLNKAEDALRTIGNDAIYAELGGTE